MRQIIHTFDEKDVLQALLHFIDAPPGHDPRVFVDGSDEFALEIQFTPRPPKKKGASE